MEVVKLIIGLGAYVAFIIYFLNRKTRFQKAFREDMKDKNIKP